MLKDGIALPIYYGNYGSKRAYVFTVVNPCPKVIT
jgi:hypothetical protein